MRCRIQPWLVFSTPKMSCVSGMIGTSRSSEISIHSPLSSLTHAPGSFPTQAFPSEIQPYRPPQAIKDADIAKITSCEDTFAALSSNGELFTFTVPNPSEAERASGKDRSGIKPQRVWALRKQFSAVRVCRIYLNWLCPS